MSCPDCVTGAVLPGEPAGIISTQGAYYAAAPEPSKRAVLLLTDAFGLPLVNCKLMADEISKRLACDVWVPDLFNGNPALLLSQLTLLPVHAGVRRSWFQTLGLIFKILPRIPALYAARASVVDPRVTSFINAVKAEKKYESIGAVGYCFGGGVAIRLAGTDLLKAAVICHPSPPKPEQLKAIKIPCSWACAEEDSAMPEKLRLEAEAEFINRKGKENYVDYEFKVHPGTAHGYAARPDPSIPAVQEAYEKTMDQTIDWFNKTLIV